MKFSGIKYHLLLLGIFPSFLFAIALVFYFTQFHYDHLENELKVRGQTIVNQLAISSASGLFSKNTAILTNITYDFLTKPDVVSISIVDNFGFSLTQSKQQTPFFEQQIIYFHQPINFRDFNKTITLLDETSLSQTTKIGSVKMGLSLANMHKKQQAYLLKGLQLFSIGIICTLLVAIYLSRRISSPIIKLTQVVNNLADVPIDIHPTKSHLLEINKLYQSFNTMAIELQETRNKLKNPVNFNASELNKTLLNNLKKPIIPSSQHDGKANTVNYVKAMLGKISGNKELATTLFYKLFVELHTQLQIIEKALNSHDFSTAEEETHKLHGSVSFCGFTDFQIIAKNLEIALSENNSAQINKNFTHLKNKITDFIKSKKSILEELNSDITAIDQE